MCFYLNLIVAHKIPTSYHRQGCERITHIFTKQCYDIIIIIQFVQIRPETHDQEGMGRLTSSTGLLVHLCVYKNYFLLTRCSTV